MRAAKKELPATAQTSDYTGDAFYISGGHRPYMLEETELLQLTRKSDHHELVRQFVAAGLFPSS